MTKENFINIYVDSLRKNEASIFVGAGFSKSATNVDWELLVKPYAEKISAEFLLKENNYPYLMQVYLNTTKEDIGKLKKDISDKFKNDKVEKKYEYLALMPIKNFWTTNYDTLFENAFKANNNKYFSIFDNDGFEKACYKDKVLYKCHGDCNNSDSIIITQEDYDKYYNTHPNFITAFINEMNTGTFLFLGYSFSDPDINSLISKVKLNNKIPRKHYLITRKETENINERRQNLWIENIRRYGIETIVIDDYDEIEEIIKKIYNKYMCSKILISGSTEYNTGDEFIRNLGYNLLNSFHKYGIEIVNGYGKGVAPHLLEGMAEAAVDNKINMANHLRLFPFSKKYYENFIKDKKIEAAWKDYRTKMVNQAGIVIFIYGNRYDDKGIIVDAPGVEKEFEIAVQNGKYVIPLGQTNHMSKVLSDRVSKYFEKYNGNDKKLKELYIKLLSIDINKNEFFVALEEMIKYLF